MKTNSHSKITFPKANSLQIGEIVKEKEILKSKDTNEFVVVVYGEIPEKIPEYHTLSAQLVDRHYVLIDSIKTDKENKETQNLFEIICECDSPFVSFPDNELRLYKQAENRLYKKAKEVAEQLSKEYKLPIINNTNRQ